MHSYSLAKDINKLHKRSVTQDELLSPALVGVVLYFLLFTFVQVVMSGFGSEENHVKLMKTMFQNMFPTLSVANVSAHYLVGCLFYYCRHNKSSVNG